MSSEFLRSWQRVIVTGATVAAVLGGAGLTVAAGSPGMPASAATATVSRIAQPPPGHPSWGGAMRILHGQAVVAKRGGGYQTIVYQRGTVTAVSMGSITVKSTDGFTRTYTVNGSTIVGAQRGGIGSVATGNQVSVIATVSGTTLTAARIIDWTQLQHSHTQFGLGSGAHG
ncbi:MAG TPA: hypothetical protein VMA72_12160 [Streptosporangiaceae bacterium]|nr:hypothetical protein [Streptosporangiaceae bacterium]